MEQATRKFYDKRGQTLVKHLQKRHFEAYYCPTKEAALERALALIPEGSSVGWGGAIGAGQVGVQQAVKNGNYTVYDRDECTDPADRAAMMRKCLDADFFVTGANALSLDGQMVNIDGMGNRVAAMIYGPKYVLVVAGMNKVCDTIEDAVKRARTIAAPQNAQRFGLSTPCDKTGSCDDCISEDCICNQIVITRHCRPAGRIKFIIVGEELGF